MTTARMKRWSSRLGLGTLCLSSFGAIYLGACSDDDAPPATPTNEAGPNPDTPDTGGGGGGDATPDVVKACTDTPFDCSATAGDAGVDDSGTGNVVGPAATVPYNLRCTELYSCWTDKTINSATHREYTPAFQLWSDGAEKTRWMVIPAGGTIDTGDPTGADMDGGSPDDWIYPVGTMVYKEFKLGGKRIETRRIWKASETEWVYSVWRWSADESTATLMNKGEVLPNTANAGKNYEIPSNQACANCHDGHRDKFLSLDAWSLAAGSTGVTLAMLKAEGKLPKWNAPTSFAVPQDPTGKLDKAVGFYYNNCGFCHKPGRPGGGSGLHLHLPVAAALPGTGVGVPTGLPDGGAGLVHTETPVYKTAVDVAHANEVGGLFPFGTYKRITKGNASLSVLPGRDSLRDPDGGIAQGQMPNVLSRVVDPNGVERTKEWINALPP